MEANNEVVDSPASPYVEEEAREAQTGRVTVVGAASVVGVQHGIYHLLSLLFPSPTSIEDEGEMAVDAGERFDIHLSYTRIYPYTPYTHYPIHTTLYTLYTLLYSSQ